mmetsp:Transcript_54202/g.128743  ORF Transcript_54202/g.128743 Transcript_54202/m.128743 type:complete len:620 (-) Transcript_54202:301-2160(-)
MEDGVRAEHALHVRVVRRKRVRGGRGLGEEEAHGVALIAERGLHANEDVAELLAVDEEVLAVRVELPGGLAPVLLQLLGVGSHLLVLLDGHLVLHVEVRGPHARFLVVEDHVHDLLGLGRHVAERVALATELFAHRGDGREHVQVRGGADVALVGREREDGDRELLVLVLLDAEVGPLERAVREEVDAVREGHGAPSDAVAAAVDDRLDGPIDLRERDLQSDLDGVQAELGGLPLLEGLEHEGHGADVRAVQLREHLDGLVMVLGGGAADEREAGQVDHRVGHDGALGEEVTHGAREVKPARVEADHAGAARLELLDERGVVGLVLGVDVRLLEDQPDGGRGRRVDAEQLGVSVVEPVVVLHGVLEHLGGERVPDADVREEGRLRDLVRDLVLALVHVLVGHHEEKRLEVLRGATEPVLEGEHEAARILRLVRRKVLENLGEGAEELEHGALEGRAVLLLFLLHELADHRLRLPELRHRERANLVEAHHVRHGGEDEHGVKLVAQRRHHLNNLLSELLHEDERADEDVGRLDVGLERLERRGVAQLLEEVPHRLDTHVVLASVDALARHGHRRLVLRLEHNVHNLELLAPVDVLRDDTAILGVASGEESAAPGRDHRLI